MGSRRPTITIISIGRPTTIRIRTLVLTIRIVQLKAIRYFIFTGHGWAFRSVCLPRQKVSTQAALIIGWRFRV